MSKLRNFWNEVRPRGGWKYPAIIICGAFMGLFIYTFLLQGPIAISPATRLPV